MVAVTAAMVTTLYQGRPADTARLTIDHQTRLDGYGGLGKAVVGADRAARAGDGGALNGALGQMSSAAARLSPLLDRDTVRFCRSSRRVPPMPAPRATHSARVPGARPALMRFMIASDCSRAHWPIS